MRTSKKVGRAPPRGVVHVHVLIALSMVALGTFASALPEAGPHEMYAESHCLTCNLVMPVGYSFESLTPGGSEGVYDLYAAIAFCKETGWWRYRLPHQGLGAKWLCRLGGR